MNVRDLAVKFHAYAHYVTARDWARETLSLPSLFRIVPDIAQERRMQRVAQGKLAHIPVLVLWTTTEVLFHRWQPSGYGVFHSPVKRHRQRGRTDKACSMRFSESTACEI
jgi:hypothetical protein